MHCGAVSLAQAAQRVRAGVSLAAAMHVRKSEITVWIEQGWLEAVREDAARPTSYKISPEALQRCLRGHLPDLQKRNIRSANILAVFQLLTHD